jgi:hypothetical protein
MSLHTALKCLPRDRETESTTREVLEFMRGHVGEYLSAPEVARRLQQPENRVGVILSTLAEGCVVQAGDEHFRYDRDPLTDLDVQRFLRQAEHHTQLVQNNVAKFRERYGYR